MLPITWGDVTSTPGWESCTRLLHVHQGEIEDGVWRGWMGASVKNTHGDGKGAGNVSMEHSDSSCLSSQKNKQTCNKR